MLTSYLHPLTFLLMSQQSFDTGNDAIAGHMGEGVESSQIGKDLQQMNIHFDRASNWDPEREELTDRQRLRDLETYVFGDRRGFTIGVMRQMRNHLVWLVTLSICQFVALLLQAILIWSLLRNI